MIVAKSKKISEKYDRDWENQLKQAISAFGSLINFAESWTYHTTQEPTPLQMLCSASQEKGKCKSRWSLAPLGDNKKHLPGSFTE